MSSILAMRERQMPRPRAAVLLSPVLPQPGSSFNSLTPIRIPLGALQWLDLATTISDDAWDPLLPVNAMRSGTRSNRLCCLCSLICVCGSVGMVRRRS
jgi:hypothetical protein